MNIDRMCKRKSKILGVSPQLYKFPNNFLHVFQKLKMHFYYQHNPFPMIQDCFYFYNFIQKFYKTANFPLILWFCGKK